MTDSDERSVSISRRQFLAGVGATSAGAAAIGSAATDDPTLALGSTEPMPINERFNIDDYRIGPLSERPAAADVKGAVYEVTDNNASNGTLRTFSDGSQWVTLNVEADVIDTEQIGNSEFRASAFGSDGAAIQSALDETNGTTWSKVVIDDLGVDAPYLVSSPLSVPSRTVVEIAGDVKAAAGLNHNIFQTANFSDPNTDDTHIYFIGAGGEIDGNKANQSANGGTLSPGYYNCAIQIRGGQYVHVRNLNIKNAYNHGIHFSPIDYGAAIGNSISDCGLTGIQSHWGEANNRVNTYVRIKDNELERNASRGAAAAIYTAGVQHHELEGNTSVGCGNIAFNLYNGDAALLTKDVTWKNNSAANPSSHAFNINTTTKTTNAGMERISVSGGTLDGSGNDGVAVTAQNNGIDDLTISGVNVVSPTDKSIHIEASGASITGLSVTDCPRLDNQFRIIASGAGIPQPTVTGNSVNAGTGEAVLILTQNGNIIERPSIARNHISTAGIGLRLNATGVGGVRGGVVDGNDISGQGTADGNTAMSLLEAENTKITGNEIDAIQYPLSSGANCANLVVVYNDIRGAGGALNLNGTGTITELASQGTTEDWNVT